MTIFDFLFNKELIYTALTIEDYLKVAHRFKTEGLYYKVKRHSNNNLSPGQFSAMDSSNNSVLYEFYVKTSDQYKAQKLLSTINT